MFHRDYVASLNLALLVTMIYREYRSCSIKTINTIRFRGNLIPILVCRLLLPED